jgi:pimeloyl-ACP methyl ester carboxylesterase
MPAETLIPTPRGSIRAVAEGDPKNPGVILIHGATIPAFTYVLLAPLLAQEGLFTVRYDLWGRGGSELPPGELSLADYQLAFEHVANHFNFQSGVSVVGYSLGGGLAAAFAQSNAIRVERLALIAPVTDDEALRHFPPIMREAKKGEIIMKVFGKRRARVRAAQLFPQDTLKVYKARYEVEVTAPHFVPTTLAMLRGGILEGYAEAYDAVAQRKVPTWMVWGDGDLEVPPENLWRLKSKLDARAEVHADVGHGLVFKKPEAIAPSLAAFLRDKEVRAAPAFVPGRR